MREPTGVAAFADYVRVNQPKSLVLSEMREWFVALMQVTPTPPEAKLEPSGASVPASWISPEGADPSRVILYLHGGGHIFGSPRTHLETIYRLARAAGVRALAVDYRLAPENPWPAGVEDCVAAYRWLLAEGVSASRIAIAGDSAGGGLTIGTLLALRDAGDPLPGCAVCCSPWVDFTGSGESVKTNAGKDPMIDPNSLGGMTMAVLGGKDPMASSPLFADLSGLPPLFVQVGSSEVLFDDAVRLVEKTSTEKARNVLDSWEGMVHGFQAFPGFFPEAIPAVERAAAFIKEKLG